jgi:predicted glycosyl hydrolase (DUF1957 family)
MKWVNVFHLYQPPHWNPSIIRRVARESYVPLMKFLVAHPRIRVTLNVAGSLTRQLEKLGYAALLRDMATVGKRGQVEFLASAMYHPILPLVPEREVKRQIQLNTEMNRRILGAWYKPRGFFPPELAIDSRTAHIIARLGFSYLLADEISAHGNRRAKQTHIHRLSKTKMRIAFRYRSASDYIAFSATGRDLNKFVDLVSVGLHGDILLTAMDGENLGHHRRVTATFWYKVVQQSHIKTMTLGDLVRVVRTFDPVTPHAGSWSTTEDDIRNRLPFPLWHDPANELHKLQWELTNLMLKTVEQARRDPGYAAARHELDQTLASDQFWWASMKPWWSMEIVQDAALRSLTTLANLSAVRDNTHTRARKLAEAIIQTATKLQDSGEAQQRRQTYLDGSKRIQFLGGEKVK